MHGDSASFPTLPFCALRPLLLCWGHRDFTKAFGTKILASPHLDDGGLAAASRDALALSEGRICSLRFGRGYESHKDLWCCAPSPCATRGGLRVPRFVGMLFVGLSMKFCACAGLVAIVLVRAAHPGHFMAQDVQILRGFIALPGTDLETRGREMTASKPWSHLGKRERKPHEAPWQSASALGPSVQASGL